MMRRPFFIRILCVNNIKTLKSQTLDRLSNYLSIFLFIFLLFFNVNRILRNFSFETSKSKLCNINISSNSLINNVDLFRDNLYKDNLSFVSISIFPEVFSGLNALGSKCFGMFVTNNNLNEIFFVLNNFIFYIALIIFLFFLIFFISNDNDKNLINYIKYVLIFFTLLNIINFQSSQFSFVFFSLMSIASIRIIFKATLLDKSISTENFHADLKIFLISWVFLGVNEMKKFMYDDNNFYHFSLWYTNY